MARSSPRGPGGLGAWVTSPDPVQAEAVAATGFDWVLVDTQHGTVTDTTLGPVLQAIELGGATPLVRVAANDERLIGTALDLGAAGVVVPLVSGPDDAAAAVRAAHHPPRGVRSYGPSRPRAQAEQPLVLPMIETTAGLGQVDAITAVAGVDGLFLGTVDLGLALGLGVVTGPPPRELAAAVDTCAAAGRRRQIPVGGVAADADAVTDLLARGLSFLTVAADRAVIASGMARALQAARERTT